MDYKGKTALVTAIGSFSSMAVIGGLKKMGWRVVGCDIYPREWIAQSLETAAFYQAPLARDEEKYLTFIRKVCLQEKVEMILPLTDVEVDVFHRNRELFSGEHILVGISSQETIALARNKFALAKKIVASEGLGKPIPTVKLSEWNRKEWMGVYGSRLILKPWNGRSSSGLYRVRGEGELTRALEEIHEEGREEEYLVQPMIEGNVVTTDVVRGKDGSFACLPRRELLRTLNGAGTSVQVFRNPELEQMCRKAADLLSITGCVNFEWIEERWGNGRCEYRFLECNPRFSGGVGFSCLAGYDMVQNHVRAFYGLPVEEENRAAEGYLAKVYRDVATAGEGLEENKA